MRLLRVIFQSIINEVHLSLIKLAIVSKINTIICYGRVTLTRL